MIVPGEIIPSYIQMLSYSSCVKVFWGQTGCFGGNGCCCCQQQCLGAVDQPCPEKWGLNYALKPNIVNTKYQHQTPFVIPTKVTVKLAALHRLLLLHHWKRSFPHFFPLSNEHIALRSKTLHLRNPHAKTCTHYLHRYFYPDCFCPSVLTPISQAYAPWYGSDNYPLSVYLGGWTVKYNLQ